MKATLDAPTDPAAYRFCHRVRVRFAETDAMGVVHHGAYLLYLESARVEYLRAAGHPYTGFREEGLKLPVVELHARYLRPCVFDDVVEVRTSVTAVRGASFELGYLLTVDGEPRLSAVTVHAVVGRSGRPVRCPPWLAALAAPAAPTAPAEPAGTPARSSVWGSQSRSGLPDLPDLPDRTDLPVAPA